MGGKGEGGGGGLSVSFPVMSFGYEATGADLVVSLFILFYQGIHHRSSTLRTGPFNHVLQADDGIPPWWTKQSSH